MPVGVPGTAGDVLMWAPLAEVDQMALSQLRNVSTLPWVHGVRVMPDVHGGYGVPVGSVIAMRQAVSPSAVGVDIGCGMAAVRTSLTLADLPDDLGHLRQHIEDVVPVGFRGHDHQAPATRRNEALKRQFQVMFGAQGTFNDLRVDMSARESRAVAQCGSLGSGNHFIELCADAEGRLWVTLHSGSRNIGKELAERHIKKAKGLDHNRQLADPDLAVFLAGTELMADYLHDLYWAQDYALLNRRVMLESVMTVLRETFAGIAFDKPVECHHNYVSEETYDGVPLTITRKGAIFAGAGALGVIPGSMGTGSYIVRGLGNEASYCSASHGAGRRMSRGAARRTFTLDDLAAQTRGVECRKDAGVIDEAPGAYKDLAQVIANQADLIEVVTRLETLLCVKG
ncbi:RtcB family protein [Propioniciclava sp.]|uniref:RtcB family protein n=1 Tax=Propioniciclava sp. TaxID=2038686 RepID=UPI0039E32E54